MKTRRQSSFVLDTCTVCVGVSHISTTSHQAGPRRRCPAGLLVSYSVRFDGVNEFKSTTCCTIRKKTGHLDERTNQFQANGKQRKRTGAQIGARELIEGELWAGLSASRSPVKAPAGPHGVAQRPPRQILTYMMDVHHLVSDCRQRS